MSKKILIVLGSNGSNGANDVYSAVAVDPDKLSSDNKKESLSKCLLMMETTDISNSIKKLSDTEFLDIMDWVWWLRRVFLFNGQNLVVSFWECLAIKDIPEFSRENHCEVYKICLEK